MNFPEVPILFELPTLPIPWTAVTAIITFLVMVGLTVAGIAAIQQRRQGTIGFPLLGVALVLWILTLYDPAFRQASPLGMPGWMQWTVPTGTFMVFMLVLLTTLTTVDMVSPTGHPSGVLPLPFSRGERVFLSFMVFFAIIVLWLAFLPGISIWIPLGVAAALIVATMIFA